MGADYGVGEDPARLGHERVAYRTRYVILEASVLAWGISSSSPPHHTILRTMDYQDGRHAFTIDIMQRHTQ